MVGVVFLDPNVVHGNHRRPGHIGRVPLGVGPNGEGRRAGLKEGILVICHRSRLETCGSNSSLEMSNSCPPPNPMGHLTPLDRCPQPLPPTQSDLGIGNLGMSSGDCYMLSVMLPNPGAGFVLSVMLPNPGAAYVLSITLPSPGAAYV